MKRSINPVLAAIFFIIPLLITACNNRDVFFQYSTLPVEGWHKDSLLVFDVPVTDSAATYNVYLYIRNSNSYPYQNFWFFTEKTTVQGSTVNDTIECYLADRRGKWLGSGAGALFEMPVVIEQNISFERNGIYRYRITQGMREDILQGISDIGLRVEKNETYGKE
jgi:gliding motility-associated lipoprotein GldH